jgi:uncharacterized membrane protein YuzA (DUF378 family)
MVESGIKAAWIGTEVGSLVLGVREVLEVTPIVDLIGSGTPSTVVFAAFGLAGVISIAHEFGAFEANN